MTYNDSIKSESGYGSSSSPPTSGRTAQFFDKADNGDSTVRLRNHARASCTSYNALVTPEMGQHLNFSLINVSLKKPRPGEVVIRILYSGLCRSVACFSVGPEPGFPKYGHIAGHEGIGHVVETYDPSLLGRCVAIRYLGTSCGWCTYCLQSLPTSCPFQLNVPKQVPDMLQQFATIPTSCIIPLPDRRWDLTNGDAPASIIPPAACASLCSGSCAFTALQAASTKASDVVVVVGIAGAIGHIAGAIAKHVLGAKVIGVDLSWKIDALRKNWDHFADRLISAPASGEDWNRFELQLHIACGELRNGRGSSRAAESVIVAASMSEAFVNLDRYVCDGGHIICVGVPRGNCPISIPAAALVERNLHLTGNLMGGHKAALTVLEYIVSGQIAPSVLEIPLEDVPKHMERLTQCRAVGKNVVRLW